MIALKFSHLFCKHFHSRHINGIKIRYILLSFLNYRNKQQQKQREQQQQQQIMTTTTTMSFVASLWIIKSLKK